MKQTRVMRDMDGGVIGSARYVWRGPPGDPMFVMQNCRDVTSSRVDIVVESPCEAVVVVERTKSGPGVIPSTMHGFHRWRVFGNGLAPVGFWYRATVDENNEHGRWAGCSIYGCNDGLNLHGSQSKEHLVTHCRFEGGAHGGIAIEADSGFQMIGGAVSGFVTAIALRRVGDPVTIQGVGVEACSRLLLTSGPTTAAQPVILQNVRYEADQLAADGEMIVMRHAGPLVMLGGRYGGGRQRVPRIALRGTGPQCVEFVGRPLFGAFGADLVNPVIAQNPAEASVIGQYIAQRMENPANGQNTQLVDAITVGRLTT